MRVRQRSIRDFILRSIFISALLAGIVTVLTSYYLNLKDLRPYLDSHLIIENQTVTDNIKLLREQKKNISEYFQNRAPQASFEYDYTNNSDLVHQLIGNTHIQIQTMNGEILFQNHSHQPTRVDKEKKGFSYQEINNELYRVYTTYHPSLDVIISSMQPHKVRQMLESSMVIKFVSIFLIIYVILSITISIVLKRAFLLIETAYELLDQKKSDPQSDITKKDLPIELQPFFESLNSLISQLDQSLQREKRFAYDAAHELKTPLAALQTHLQIAKITKDEGKRQESLNKATLCIKRSCHTIDQLMALIRTLPNKNKSSMQVINITPTLADIQSQNPIINLNQTSPVFALADPDSLSMIFKIITENAIKFGATSMDIHVSESKKYVTLSCIDNGPGVPKAHINRLGERFFRVYGTNVDGSGIGLNIAMEIISQIQGALYFSQNTPQGLCVHICLKKQSKN